MTSDLRACRRVQSSTVGPRSRSTETNVTATQSLSWWQTNHLSWSARWVFICCDVSGGRWGSKCTTEICFWNEHSLPWLWFSTLALFVYFFNWWNLVGCLGKHLLDNQHCIHRNQNSFWSAVSLHNAEPGCFSAYISDHWFTLGRGVMLFLLPVRPLFAII